MYCFEHANWGIYLIFFVSKSFYMRVLCISNIFKYLSDCENLLFLVKVHHQIFSNPLIYPRQHSQYLYLIRARYFYGIRLTQVFNKRCAFESTVRLKLLKPRLRLHAFYAMFAFSHDSCFWFINNFIFFLIWLSSLRGLIRIQNKFLYNLYVCKH